MAEIKAKDTELDTLTTSSSHHNTAISSYEESFVRFEDGTCSLVGESLAYEEDFKLLLSNGANEPKEYKVFTGRVTPLELEDYSYGLCFDLGYIQKPQDIQSLRIEQEGGYICAHVELSTACLERPQVQKKLESLNEPGAKAVQELMKDDSSLFKGTISPSTPLSSHSNIKLPISPGFPVSAQLIYEASKTVRPYQILNKKTGSTHAACFISLEGEFLVVREDLARHSAVTKMIGACLRQGISPKSGFAFLCSRCAAELAVKLARFGIELMATISAPTYTAMAFARQANMTICSYARGNCFTCYSAPERFIEYKSFED